MFLSAWPDWADDRKMGFRRFWARRESCLVQTEHILVGSTCPVFAPYWSVPKPVRRLHGPALHPVHTLGSHACDLSIRHFMPRSHEALGQSTGPVRAKHV